MYGVSYGRLPLFKVCGGASPSCRRNPLALGRGGSQTETQYCTKTETRPKQIEAMEWGGIWVRLLQATKPTPYRAIN